MRKPLMTKNTGTPGSSINASNSCLPHGDSCMTNGVWPMECATTTYTAASSRMRSELLCRLGDIIPVALNNLSGIRPASDCKSAAYRDRSKNR